VTLKEKPLFVELWGVFLYSFIPFEEMLSQSFIVRHFVVASYLTSFTFVGFPISTFVIFYCNKVQIRCLGLVPIIVSRQLFIISAAFQTQLK
jgi:hypothetical protein